MGKLRLILFAGLLAVLQITTTPKSKACDVADFTLNSLTQIGPSLWQVNTTLCMGAGNLPGGGNPGSIGPTFSFGFGFWTPGGVPITVSGYPASITSDTLMTTNIAIPQGPGFFGTQEFILYADPGTPFGCQFDAVPCGLPHQECYVVNFIVDVLPDSIRAFAVEGSNNPTGGCYPNTDMVIDFTGLPVIWSDFNGNLKSDGIDLTWVTAVEENNDHFRVLRSADGVNYTELDRVNAIGNSRNSSEYGFFDDQPQPGLNFYKIRQVDIDGKSSDSEVLSFSFTPQNGLVWEGVGPVPAGDYLNLRFNSGSYQDLNLEVYDLRGYKVIHQAIEADAGHNSLRLELQDLESGIYFIRIQNSQGVLERKFIKQ